jgi:hypothetical protein
MFVCFFGFFDVIFGWGLEKVVIRQQNVYERITDWIDITGIWEVGITFNWR